MLHGLDGSVDERTGILDIEILRFDLGLKQFEISHDDGEQVVEVMRHAARQLTDGFHLLGLLQLFLAGPLLGDILDHGDHTIAACRKLRRNDGAAARLFM